ncbi:ClcB-like voltage-gated chloride channel protein [Oleiharenicola sp. Vm1]|uniref:ClcB-like voltage-gated chloride channel protein n=1 Tax=Oleiharenicola sp. Vm1 TaxID=3398393 RepID=UPI0039F615DD
MPPSPPDDAQAAAQQAAQAEERRRVRLSFERLLNVSQQQLMKLLRRRLWLQEKLHPTEWQVTLFWSAVAGFLGALSAVAFTSLTEGVHELLTGSRAGVVETMRLIPAWAVVLVPAAGGVAAGLILKFGQRFAGRQSATDYMEAIVIGSGRIPARASLVKTAASLFTIGSGGSIGREGPLVQLAAVASSRLGRWLSLSAPKQRLLVACGASAGIASAYNAPIAGSFFVAEIILGTIAMESLGPLVIAAVTAALTMRVMTSAGKLYAVPSYEMHTPWEMVAYVLLGLIVGALAPWFLRSLRAAENFFRGTKLPLVLRLGAGGLIVGALAVKVPEVCGNGYSVVVGVLQGNYVWTALLLIVACKWLATCASFGSGAPGGVFTPSLFMGAGAGFLYGQALQTLWPSAAIDPRTIAMVGMGAFLSAASHAPVMAIIMLFEMTLSYDIILPLMVCSVVAYFTAKSLEGESLYSASLKRKAVEQAATVPVAVRVGELMRADPPTLARTASFGEIGRAFLANRVNNLYVTEPDGRFVGVVSLHDIKPFLQQPDIAEVVLANDILRDDFPTIRADQPLSDGLKRFREVSAERIPVLDAEAKLLGSLSKTDVLLALAEKAPVAPTAA